MNCFNFTDIKHKGGIYAKLKLIIKTEETFTP